jgi:hypothetical protein
MRCFRPMSYMTIDMSSACGKNADSISFSSKSATQVAENGPAKKVEALKLSLQLSFDLTDSLLLVEKWD